MMIIFFDDKEKNIQNIDPKVGNDKTDCFSNSSDVKDKSIPNLRKRTRDLSKTKLYTEKITNRKNDSKKKKNQENTTKEKISEKTSEKENQSTKSRVNYNYKQIVNTKCGDRAFIENDEVFEKSRPTRTCKMQTAKDISCKEQPKKLGTENSSKPPTRRQSKVSYFSNGI